MPTRRSPLEVDVLIVGGGPFGLMLSNELGRRGVNVALVDAKPSTASNPQANATQARTMEHYRRLGFADEVRSLGLPRDFPTDIAYFTRYATHELARFPLPSAREARERVTRLTGSWSAAELPHRVSQKYVERVLRRHAESLRGVSIDYGWRLTEFAEDERAVTARVEQVDGRGIREISARYLVAADGARSSIRRRLGIGWQGETGVIRDFFGGRMYAIYLSAPAFYDLVPGRPAWMNVTFNRDRRAFMAAVDGRGEFAFHTQLRDDEDERRIDEADALAMFRAAVGAELDARIIARDAWTAGHALVAESFRRGRIFLGGDAAHLFTPAGGLGYNTAVEDAVNLGWKLAATLRGTGGPHLLDSYEPERRPAAVRNTGYARSSRSRSADCCPNPDSRPRGRSANGSGARPAGTSSATVAPSSTSRASRSAPATTAPRSSSPTDPHPRPTRRTATSRAPRRADGRPTCGSAKAARCTTRSASSGPCCGSGPTRRPSIACGAPPSVGAPLALIRPDQVVAWRGAGDSAAERILATVTGAQTAVQSPISACSTAASAVSPSTGCSSIAGE